MTWAPHPQARRLSPAEEAAAYARLLSQLEEAIAEARSRAQWAIAEDNRAHGISTTVAPGQFDPRPLSAEEARLRAQLQDLRALLARGERPPLSGGLGAGGADLDVVVAVGAAIFLGMTVASYYLVRGVAPKKSANAYGGAAAASNILFPLIGPIVVGIVAANAEGKR